MKKWYVRAHHHANRSGDEPRTARGLVLLGIVLALFVATVPAAPIEPAPAQAATRRAASPHPGHAASHAASHAAAQAAAIDAARLNTVVPLTASWRFSPADDLQFAETGTDDSGWPALEPGQALADAHLPDLPGPRSTWARLHLDIVNSTGPLGIALATRDGQQYTVYANGLEIAKSPGMTDAVRQMTQPFAIALPWNGEPQQHLTLAIRFFSPANYLIRRLPLTRVDIGHLGPITDAAELARIRTFDAESLSAVFFNLIYLCFAPIALILFLAQRDHTEYLWLAIFFVFISVFVLLTAADDAGLFPHSTANLFLYSYCGFGSMACGLEFIARFTLVKRPRPRRAIRAVQAIILLSPLLPLTHLTRLYNPVLILCVLLWIVTTSICLVDAFRRGKAESGLLLPPFVIYAAGILLGQLSEIFPTRMRLPHRFFIGHVGLTVYNLGSLVFLSGILAVVLYRFIRVTEDEQRGAAELEAARTVQSLLLPATPPATPGYRVQSVYLPAQQVGGDFFLILPDADDGSLLIIVGDVSGKGLQAAMVVSTVIGALRSQNTRSPSAILGSLNRILTGHITGFATCCALLLHPDGTLTIANAGHPAPYIAGEELLTTPGLPLGLLAEADYPATTHRLTSGQQLTCVSDGILEATNPLTRQLFGFGRTRVVSTQSAAAIAEEATRFAQPASQTDDITVLTVTRTATPARPAPLPASALARA